MGYSGFLGPIAGVMICDYFVVRKKIILVEDLYQRHGFYEFSGGINWRAMAALAAGAGVAFIGLIVPVVARPVRLRLVRGIRREFHRVLGLDARVAQNAKAATELRRSAEAFSCVACRRF